jgi:ferrous iron transport protein B
MAYGVLEITGLTDIIIEPLSPITRWLGLPAVTIIPLVFGFLQKDLTGAMLISTIGSEISLALTPIQIYTRRQRKNECFKNGRGMASKSIT